MRLSKSLSAEFLGTTGLLVIQVLHEIDIDISKTAQNQLVNLSKRNLIMP